MYKENRKIEYIKNKRIKKGSQVHHFSVPITTPYIILELERGQLCRVNLPSFQLGDSGEGSAKPVLTPLQVLFFNQIRGKITVAQLCIVQRDFDPWLS